MEDYSWPEDGDQLFLSNDPMEDAWIHPSSINFVVYADSYKRAADHLVKEAIRKHKEQDSLIYPILFLYRQHIELQMKYIIRTWYRRRKNEAPNYMHHNLERLWQGCREIIEEAWPSGDSDDVDIVEEVIHELAEADPGSFTFRYPIDTNDEPVIEEETFIDLRNLYVVMEKTSHFLDGCGEGITAMVQDSPY
jgi:predicted nucleotidyltransferase